MGMVKVKDSEWLDLLIRFVVGGTILVGVYVLSKLMPWQSIAGVFAAFPGVMSSTVGLTGWRQDSLTAAEMAKGSVIGMLGGLVCILATLATLSFIAIWWVGLAVGIIAWFPASFLLHELFYGKRQSGEGK